MSGGRLPPLDEVAASGTQVQVVEPGSPEDTVSNQASPPAQAAPSAPAGVPADQGGEAKGDVLNPAELTPARPVLAPPPPPGAQPVAIEPPAAPAAPAEPVAPVEGQPAPATPAPTQPAPAAVPAGVSPPAAPAAQAPEPVAPVVPAPKTEEEIRQEVETAASVKVAAVQSGVDKRMNTMQATQDDLVTALNTQKIANRDLVLNGVPEEQKALKLKEWELEDKITENEKLRKETLSYGTDVELASLLIDFREVPGVTEEALGAIPIDERDIWCMTKRNEHLQEQLTAAQNGQPAAAPAGQAPVPQPVLVPAGAEAPSDAGGAAGTAPPPGQPTHNPAQNRDAMTENMKSGWETVTFQ